MLKDKKLLFICGFPSGGTDLLKNILNAHPDVYINGEMPFLYKIHEYGYRHDSQFKNIGDIYRLRKILKLIDVYNNFENIDLDFQIKLENNKNILLEEVLYYIFSNKNRLVWGNKTPQNTENILYLYELFPEAYFLLIVRDIRDVCLSWEKKWGKNKYLCANKWQERMLQVLENSKRIPRFKFIKYESLLNDTASATKKITDFLSINWSERILGYHRHIDRVIDGKINYGEEIKENNYKKWVNNLQSSEIKKIEEISFRALNYLDYEINYAKKEKKINNLEKLLFYIQDFFSIIFIGNRYSKNNTTGKRLEKILYEIKKYFSFNKKEKMP
jgi:hypothetical protein